MTRTQTKHTWLGLALLTVAHAALAQGAQPSGPPKEMAQLEAYKGSWVCHGNVPAGPYGPARKTTTTLKFEGDLDGRWISGRIADMPSKGNPQPFKGVAHMTYDSAAKQFFMLWVDNTGGRATQTASGWDTDKMVWQGEGSMDGKKMTSRDTFTRKGTDLHHLGEMQAEGKWVVVQDELCKRSAGKK
ncbi:MAG: DUF1579 family protein [Rubrivivax sp.]|nr:DUF1579 family protein [Rubrivivax sp.]